MVAATDGRVEVGLTATSTRAISHNIHVGAKRSKLATVASFTSRSVSTQELDPDGDETSKERDGDAHRSC